MTDYRHCDAPDCEVKRPDGPGLHKGWITTIVTDGPATWAHPDEELVFHTCSPDCYGALADLIRKGERP